MTWWRPIGCHRIPSRLNFTDGVDTTGRRTCPRRTAIGTSNNYANGLANAYGRQGAGPMPEGAVLAKDSFTVTGQGDVFTGPLFLMEKMEPGFSPEGRDWRYTQIMPDGSLFGTTNGEGSDRMEFCVTCHATAGEPADHLFFVPDKYRMRFLLLEQE